MIREKNTNEIVIDLTGPDGNAYVLIGIATRFAKQLGLDEEKIVAEMASGDYENLIEVFDSYFGDYVILER
jgi:hypothetical protein